MSFSRAAISPRRSRSRFPSFPDADGAAPRPLVPMSSSVGSVRCVLTMVAARRRSRTSKMLSTELSIWATEDRSSLVVAPLPSTLAITAAGNGVSSTS